VVVEREDSRSQLAVAMAERWLADLSADGAEVEVAARRAAISRERITGAPVVIVPCLELAALDTYPDERRQRAEWQMGVQSVALACQNLLLAAHHYGLVSCWMCAPIFCVPLVQEVLELPESWQPQGLLTIGYAPEGVVRDKGREPLETRVVRR
jgi:F420 biosynthesis protein FbiB-like protein